MTLCEGWSMHTQVEVISRKFVGLPGMPMCPTVFSPPMSQQRHSYLAGLVSKLGATEVTDLGCGEASLFQHLLKQVRGYQPASDVDKIGLGSCPCSTVNFQHGMQ